MSLRSIATKATTGLGIAGAALALSLAAAGPASAEATGPGLAHGHIFTEYASFNVTQNNGIFPDVKAHDVETSSISWSPYDIPGSKEMVLHNLYSDWAQTTHAYDQFQVTEIDNVGTVRVTTTQSLDFWPGEEVRSAVAVTIAPNATRGFNIVTVNGWGDHVEAYVQITNTVK